MYVYNVIASYLCTMLSRMLLQYNDETIYLSIKENNTHTLSTSNNLLTE